LQLAIYKKKAALAISAAFCFFGDG